MGKDAAALRDQLQPLPAQFAERLSPEVFPEGMPWGTRFAELGRIADTLGDAIARRLIEANVRRQADMPWAVSFSDGVDSSSNPFSTWIARWRIAAALLGQLLQPTEQNQHHVPNPGQDLRGRAFPNAACILSERDITVPEQLGLDPPVPSDQVQTIGDILDEGTCHPAAVILVQIHGAAPRAELGVLESDHLWRTQ